MLTTFFVENPTHRKKGLYDFISRAPGFRVVGETNDGVTAVEMTRQLEPDLVVIDRNVLKLDWLTVARPHATASKNTRLMLVPISDQKCLLFRARQNGVMGYYIRYSALSELTSAIKSVHGGRSHLADKASPPKKRRRRGHLRHTDQPSEGIGATAA